MIEFTVCPPSTGRPSTVATRGPSRAASSAVVVPETPDDDAEVDLKLAVGQLPVVPDDRGRGVDRAPPGLVTHLAQFLALKDYRVCVIDCDRQASTPA